MKITRRFLVEKLEELLTDEFDSSELVYETDEELFNRILQVVQYYKQRYEQLEDEYNELMYLTSEKK
jgi:hypothetical protein